MPLDIFSAVRGWASGVQAYQAGQKEQANQIWGELESQMKLMASAQNIRQSAELHPVELAGKRLQNEAFGENIATSQQTRQHGAETFDWKQQEQARLDQERIEAERGFRDVTGGTQAEVGGRVAGQEAIFKSITNNLQNSVYRKAIDMGLGDLMANKLVQEIPLDLALKTADIMSKTGISKGKDESINEYIKRVTYEYMSRKLNKPIGEIAGEKQLQDWKAEDDAAQRAADADRRADEAHRQAMLGDQRTAEDRVNTWINQMNEVIYSVQSGNPVNSAIAELMLGHKPDASALNTPELKQLVLSAIGNSIRGYYAAFPNSSIIKNGYQTYMNSSSIWSTLMNKKGEAPAPESQATPQGGTSASPGATTTPTPTSVQPKYLDRLRKNRVK